MNLININFSFAMNEAKAIAGLLLCVLFVNPVAGLDIAATHCEALDSHFDQRVCEEKGMRHRPFVLIPHRPNYLLGSWTDDLEQQNETYDDYETKFQLSFKVPLNKHHKETKWFWFFAYTQISVWQMLNDEHSSPFRDTNHEPELMLYRVTNTDIFDWRLRLINFGLFNHQSNGKSPPNSRSWNRSYIEFVLENGDNYIGLKAWHRWQESQKKDPNDAMGDDNPDIEEYVGHGELRLFHVGQQHNIGLTIRNTLHGDGRGSFQFDWTIPISEKEGLRFYIQYFKGYGETLIDYNHKRERFGIGLMLADWL